VNRTSPPPRESHRGSSNRVLVFAGGVAVATLALSLAAHQSHYFPGDLQLARAFQSMHSEALLSAMKWVSYAFEGWRSALLVLLAAALVLWRMGRFEAALTLLAGLISLLGDPIKLLVARPRPSPDLLIVYTTETGKSFPSGHSLFAALLLGTLAYFALTRTKRHGSRVLVVSCCVGMTLLVGASRVYLGVHWPSDVVGGYLFAFLVLCILIWFYQTWSGRLRNRLGL
jgi:undecaprenyl-diphosphatase